MMKIFFPIVTVVSIGLKGSGVGSGVPGGTAYVSCLRYLVLQP